MRPSWFRSMNLRMTVQAQQLWPHPQHSLLQGAVRTVGRAGWSTWASIYCSFLEWMTSLLPLHSPYIRVLSRQGTHQILLPWEAFSHQSWPRSEGLAAHSPPENSRLGASENWTGSSASPGTSPSIMVLFLGEIFSQFQKTGFQRKLWDIMQLKIAPTVWKLLCFLYQN